MNNTNINPFNEVYLKRILKVYINGYGERRDKRIGVVLNETIHRKTMIKCNRIGCTLNEAVNQILYKWSKDEKENDDTDVVNNQISLENADTNKSVNSFKKINVYGKIPDNRVDIALEKTIHSKSMAKCGRIKCSFSEAVNQLLCVWSGDIKDDEINIAIN